MPTWFGIMLSVIFVVIVLNILWGLVPRRVPARPQTRKARSEALQSVADELGMSFSPEPDRAVLEDLKETQLFLDIRLCGEPARTNSVVRNLLEDRNKELVLQVVDYNLVFSYRYEAGGYEREQTIAFFEMPGLRLPRFHAALLPQGRLANVAGRQVLRRWASQESHWKDWRCVDSDNNDPASQRYVFRVLDEKAFRHVLLNGLLGVLADASVSFEAFGNRLVFWQSERHVEKGFLHYSSSYRERLIPPEDVPGFLDECRAIYRVLSKAL